MNNSIFVLNRKYKVKKNITFLVFLLLTNIIHASKVTRVIDGDTFEIETGEKVRLIGINAPEISDIFGKESKQYLTNLIEGKEVELKDDKLSNKTDRYNRLLKYVIYNGEEINEKIILNGYATAYLKYKFEKKNQYEKCQVSASINGLGMWNNKVNNQTSQKNTPDNLIDFFSKKSSLLLLSIFILLFIGIISYFRR